MADRELACAGRSGPDEVALMQSPGCQSDANAVMHQHFHAVGAAVGKEVRRVRMGCAKDLYDPGQRGVCARSHVQGINGQP